jgi:glycosyltransferase involved in cell wall biosynthesis
VPDPDDRRLRLLYNFAAAFVFPSHFEGFGIPLLDAMACGTPIVAADTDIFHEIAAEAPFYFDPNDPDALYRGIEEAIRGGTAARHTGLGLERVKQFSWTKCAEATYAVYQKVLAN